MQRTRIAKLQKTHGIKGEMKCEFFIENPNLVLEKSIFINQIEYQFETIRPFVKNVFLVKLQNINTPEDAKSLTNQEIFCNIDDLKQNKNDLLLAEILGFSVIFEGKKIGVVGEIVNYGSGEAFEFTYNHNNKTETIVHLASEAEYNEKKKEIYINYL